MENRIENTKYGKVDFEKEIDARLTIEELIWELKNMLEDAEYKEDDMSKYVTDSSDYLIARLTSIRDELKRFEEEHKIYVDSYNYDPYGH